MGNKFGYVVAVFILVVVIGVAVMLSQQNNQPSKKQALANSTILLSVYAYGGLCPNNNACSTTTIIKNNGTILIIPSVYFNGSTNSLNTPFIGTLNSTELYKLTTLINSENFSALSSHPFTGTCPTAYDGQEVVYTFNTSNGNKTIDNCKIAINSTDNLFKEINLILTAHRLR